MNIDVQANDRMTSWDIHVTQVSTPSNGTVKIAEDGGYIVYTPLSNWYGTDVFTYAHSNMLSASQYETVTVTIDPVNDPPEILTTDLGVATEDEPYEHDLQADDIDEGQGLTWSFDTDAVWLSIDTLTNELTGLPLYMHVGTYWVNISVTDSSDSSTWRMFTLEVLQISDHVPVWLETPGDQDLMEGDPLFLVVLAEDMDGHRLTYGLTSTPTSDIAITPETGAISWLATVPGTFALEITATDGTQTITHELTVTVDARPGPPVTPDNKVPVVQDVSDTNVTAGEAFTVSLSGSDGDVWDAANLTFTLKSGPVGLVVSADGEVLWLPTDSQEGTHQVEVELSDSKDIVTASFDVEVLKAPQVNDGNGGGGNGGDTSDDYLWLVMILAVVVVVLAVVMLMMYVRQR